MSQKLSASILGDDKRIPNSDYHDQQDEDKEVHYTCRPPLPPPPPTVAVLATTRDGRIGSYNKYMRILVVGDGDFSFSTSLALTFGPAHNMVSTSLDSLGFLMKNYKRSINNIDELKARGCMVLHCVDATQMANHPRLSPIKFDRIIFNFPLVGFFPRNVPRQLQIQVNQSLVAEFMANAKRMIEEEYGEIHITHKANGFFKEWNLEQLGQSQGLWLKEEVNFQLSNYPGYQTKYGFGGDKDFDCSNSKTYKFKLMPFDFSKISGFRFVEEEIDEF